MKKTMICFRLPILSIVVSLLFLPAETVHAQTLGSLFNSSNHPAEMRVSRGMELEDALKILEGHFNIVFLYETESVRNERVSGGFQVPGNIDRSLEILLEGKGLDYKYFNPKTYGIYRVSAENESSMAADEWAELQQRVSGQVVDADTGEPIPGVNILVRGTATGTTTDADGIFEMSVPSLDVTLLLSYIGYQTMELPLGGQSTLNVRLVPETIIGDELIVVGYGMVRKSDLTGSVSSITQNNIRDLPAIRPENALQGRASGVTVTNQSGAPGGDIRIRIRGINSITGENDPLYVIDGVAVSGQQQFSNLNVNDIASIEVLKDASATAIYGSRGANGVVLITTRQGSEGRVQINFRANQSWGQVTDLPERLDAADFARFYNEYRRAQGATTDFYSQEQIREWENTGGFNYLEELFQVAHSQNYAMSVSGGSESVRYFISGDVIDSDGTLINSSFRRLGFRTNINADVTERFSVDVGLNVIRRLDFNNAQRGGGGSAIRIASIYAPTIPLYDSNGNWERDNVSSLSTNPYGERQQSVTNDDDSYLYGGKVRLDYDLPVKGLHFNVIGGIDYRNRQRYAMSSMERGLDTQNSASSSNNTWTNWQVTNQLNYILEGENHTINLMAASEFSRHEYEANNLSINNLLTESLAYWDLSLGSINNFGNSTNSSSIASYFTRVNYNLKERYLLTGTLRYDGSSRFQGKNKWGYFPSIAFAWNAANEEFINSLGIFSDLRLRLSWGISGTQSIPPYSTLGLLGQSYYGFGTSTPMPGYTARNFSSPDLSWEKTAQWNLGLDFGFFDYRLLFSTNLFYKQTRDLLLNVPLPLHIGGGTVLDNVGRVDNKGVELDITAIPVRQTDFRWESNINVGYIKNEVVDLGGDERLFPGGRFGGDNTFNMAVLQVGEPMGSIWGFEWLGIWGTDEAAEAARYGQKPGDNKFLDVNDDGEYDSADHRIIGKAFPDVTFGWNNTLSWKAFDFSLFIQGAVGADRLNVTRQGMSSIISEARFITSKEGFEKMWTPENQNTNIPNHFSGTTRSIIESSQWLESADFIRLKSLNIGYTFNEFFNSGVSVRFNAGIENIYTLTNYTGMDPEVSANTGNPDTNAGIEFGGWPNPRTITIGFNVDF